MADEQPVTDISVMEAEGASDKPEVSTEEHDCETPNRWRRTMFIFVSCGLAYVSVMVLAFLGTGKIAEMVADGLISFLMVVAVSYVAAHSIDRSEIFTKMSERFGRRYNAKDE